MSLFSLKRSSRKSTVIPLLFFVMNRFPILRIYHFDKMSTRICVLIRIFLVYVFFSCSGDYNKKPPRVSEAVFLSCWHYLSSRQVTLQVLSARTSLTSVFGMGTGGPSSQSIPTYVVPCGDFMSKTFVCDF